jgi:hypothetical protein
MLLARHYRWYVCGCYVTMTNRCTTWIALPFVTLCKSMETALLIYGTKYILLTLTVYIWNVNVTNTNLNTSKIIYIHKEKICNAAIFSSCHQNVQWLAGLRYWTTFTGYIPPSDSVLINWIQFGRNQTCVLIKALPRHFPGAREKRKRGGKKGRDVPVALPLYCLNRMRPTYVNASTDNL